MPEVPTPVPTQALIHPTHEGLALAINYEPPQPVSPYTSAAFGAAQEYDQMAPTILGYRQQQLQGGIAGGQAYQAGVNASTQRGDVAGQQYLAANLPVQQQAFQYEAENQRFQHQAQLQYAQMEQQAAEQRSQQIQQQRLQDQQFQQQVEADRVHLTFQEQMQLERYRGADADVDGMLGAGRITDEEATEMKAQIRKLAGPLELRKVKSQAIQAEAAAQAENQKTAWYAQKDAEFREFSARQFPKTTGVAQDPSVRAKVLTENEAKVQAIRAAMGDAAAEAFIDGEVGKRDGHLFFYQAEPGKWTQAKVERQAKAEDTNAPPKGSLTESQYLTKHMEVMRRVDHQIAADSKADTSGGVGHWWASQPEKRQEAIANEMARLGLPPTYGEYVERVKRAGAAPAPGGPAPGPQAGPPTGQPGQAPAAPKFMDIGPSFDLGKPDTATEPQRKLIGLWRDDLKAVAAAPIPDGPKRALLGQSQWAMHALAEHGSVAAMPPPVQQRYLAVQDAVAKLPRTPTPQEQRHDQQREDALRNTPPAVDWKNKFERGDLVTSDDIPGVPFLKRQFK